MGQFAKGAELLMSGKDNEWEDYVVLLKWRNDYVVARMKNLSDKEWYWGHYYYKFNDGWNRAFARFMQMSGKSGL
jgi:hypothetical protein